LENAIDEPLRQDTSHQPGAQSGPAAKKGPSLFLQASRYSYLGLFFGCAITIGFAGGNWLDRRFHTAPWLMLLGVLLGIAASFKELLRMVASYQKDLKKSSHP
jgi:hypothetical protein